MLQIDSVNILMRAHYFPLFSRLGAYPVKLLDEASYSPKRRHFFEYWGHEACLLPLEVFPLLRWRMERARNFVGTWTGLARFAKSNQDFVERVFEIVTRAWTGERRRNRAAPDGRATTGPAWLVGMDGK